MMRATQSDQPITGVIPIRKEPHRQLLLPVGLAILALSVGWVIVAVLASLGL